MLLFQPMTMHRSRALFYRFKSKMQCQPGETSLVPFAPASYTDTMRDPTVLASDSPSYFVIEGFIEQILEVDSLVNISTKVFSLKIWKGKPSGLERTSSLATCSPVPSRSLEILSCMLCAMKGTVGIGRAVLEDAAQEEEAAKGLREGTRMRATQRPTSE